MADGDGNGWVACDCGERHWGRYGAAGLLLAISTDTSVTSPGFPTDTPVLLQHRALWSHQGGTWGLPGGARDSHEDVVTTALRETMEETGVNASSAALLGVLRVDHGTWSYDTVMMSLPALPTKISPNHESEELRWVPVGEMPDYPLHSGLAAALPNLVGPKVRVLVDAANVVGSRPDGWWRDRVAASERLLAGLSGVVGRKQDFGPTRGLAALIEVVLEGQSAQVTGGDPAVLAVAATGTADDALVARCRPGDVVVTADAHLRRRVEARGAIAVGPRWILERMPPPDEPPQ